MVEEDPRSAPFHLRQLGTHPSDTCRIERLRMARPPFSHRPVMLDEVLDFFAPIAEMSAGLVIDMTLGGAGHTIALLDAYPQISVLGIDRDADAIEAATEKLRPYGDRAAVANVRFDELVTAAQMTFPNMPIVGILCDLGVSSPQLDWAERGFSYRSNGPLDMRMDRRQPLTAAEVVNDYDVATLSRILRDGGEEKFYGRIAKAIVAARPLVDTDQLAEVVRTATPAAARRRPGDPAKRTFQALRMYVNAELEALASALDVAINAVAPGGRLVTIAYHSGEDRMIKASFLNASTGGCVCPPTLPCVCGAKPLVRILTRGSRKPTEVEVTGNPRAKSARLRCVERIDEGAGS